VISGRYNPATVYWFRGLESGGFGPRKVLLEGPENFSMSTTNAADMDGDGDTDLVIGDTSGAVFWSRNDGDRKTPKFTPRQPLKVCDKELRVSHKSDPVPVDWDGDGKLDLLVGDECADVVFFRGLGEREFAPGISLFTQKPISLRWHYDVARAVLKPFRVIPGFRSRIATADWNADGKLDLLIGNCAEGTKTEGQKHGRTVGHVYVLLRK